MTGSRDPSDPAWIRPCRVCVLCLHVVGLMEKKQFYARGGRLKNDAPKTPTLLQKCFPAYFIKYTEYTDLKMSLAVHGFIQNQLLIDRHLVISKTCWLQKVLILRDAPFDFWGGGGGPRLLLSVMVFFSEKLAHNFFFQHRP